ncbi:MAG TPA: hypothetical protein VG347_04455 [Verrucomicrobiae bacterium]|nr:hypothetical protein [Verrucomicrobiae bacterium]
MKSRFCSGLVRGNLCNSHLINFLKRDRNNRNSAKTTESPLPMGRGCVPTIPSSIASAKEEAWEKRPTAACDLQLRASNISTVSFSGFRFPAFRFSLFSFIPPIKSHLPKIRIRVENVTGRFMPFIFIFQEWERPSTQKIKNAFVNN